MNNYEYEGKLNFRFSTLHVIASMKYNRDGYLDLDRLYVWSDRRKDMVPASYRLTLRFQEVHWLYFLGQCIDHDNAMAEYYRDQRARGYEELRQMKETIEEAII